MYASGCTPYASAFVIKAKIFLIEDGPKTFALTFRKNQVGRSRRAPLFPKDSRGTDVFLGVSTP